LENDVVFAFLNRSDTNHRIAEKIFAKLEKGSLRVELSSVSLVEMELVYKSESLEDRLLEDLSAVAALPNARYVPLTPDVALASVYLRNSTKLSFFDSHYAATALSRDRKIVSFDRMYDTVPGLLRTDPTNI
jgi:predicted nucleic acid-binding protein